MATGHSEHAEGVMPPRRPVRGAAQARKRLRRELRRVGADGVRLYIDGPRGIARVRFPDQDRWLELRQARLLTSFGPFPTAPAHRQRSTRWREVADVPGCPRAATLRQSSSAQSTLAPCHRDRAALAVRLERCRT